MNPGSISYKKLDPLCIPEIWAWNKVYLFFFLILLFPIHVFGQVDAPKRDSLFFDMNGNELVNPGDSIRYILVVKNPGGASVMTIVVPNGTDPNSSLNPASILTSPLALNDGPFAVTGNMGINVPAVSGVLINDFDDSPGDLSIVNAGVEISTAEGGKITISADGSFIYDAPSGFEGKDSVAYTLMDGTPAPNCPVTNDAWVTFQVSGMIWFINEDISGGDNNGTLRAPFETLAAFEAINGNGGATQPKANQAIFLYTPTSPPTQYTGGVTLENGQKLLGQGMSTTVADVTGIILPPFSFAFPSVNTTNPILANSSGNAITLANGNDIRGLDVGSSGSPSTGSGIIGTGVGSLKIDEDVSVYVSGSSSVSAINLNTGSGAMVNLTNVMSTNGTGPGVSFNNLTGGSIAISNSINITNSGDAALSFTSCTGTLQVNSLTINNKTSHKPGVIANNGGEITVTTGTIMVDEESAISINGTAIGSSGLNFTNISVDGQLTAHTAISLINTGSGPFSCTGGTLENIQNADAVRFSNTGGAIALSNMIIEDISASTDQTAGLFFRSGIDGIHGENVQAGLTLSGCTLRRFSDNAINGAAISDGLTNTVWNGLTLNNCVISFSNRYHVSEKGDDTDEGAVRIRGISGTVLVTDCTFSDGAQFLDFSTSSSQNLDMTVQGSMFNRTIKEFACGSPTVNVGGRGISVSVNGSANAVVRVGDPAESDDNLGNSFLNNATASIVIFHETDATGDIDVVISRNDFIIDDHLTGPPGCATGTFSFNFPQGGVSLNPGKGNYEAILSHNKFDQVMHAAGGLGQFTMTADENGTSEFYIHDNEFILPWDGPVRVLADGNGTCAMLFEDNTYTDGMVGGMGDDLDMPYPSPFNPFQVFVRNGGSLDITLKDEDFPLPDPAGPGESSFDAEVQTSGNSMRIYFDNCTAPDGFDFDNATTTTFLLYSETGCAGPPTTQAIMNGNGNTGMVSTTNTITCTTTPPTLPMITIPIRSTEVHPNTGLSINSDGAHELLRVAKEHLKLHYNKEPLGPITLAIADLPENELAHYFAGVITLDRDAAGNGWFLDETPEQSEEFELPEASAHFIATVDSPAYKKIDLYSVLVHELGHACDLMHEENEFMRSFIDPGMRIILERNLKSKQ
ncbi:MAG: hypothetical protein KDC80_23290 [Saprospiraceae bacterium]|nr:hypothetical protein [Saprospiraceae bacterium]